MIHKEIKEIIDQAIRLAYGAEVLYGETLKENAASVGAQISMAKSLAVIALLLDDVINGRSTISTWDSFRSSREE